MELVRRDNSQMARNVMKEVFQALIMEGDPLKAFRAAERTIEDLAAGRVNMHNLVVTKSLSREPRECTPQAKAETYDKLLRREKESSLSAEAQRKRPAQGKAALAKKKAKKAEPVPTVAPRAARPKLAQSSLAGFLDARTVRRDAASEVAAVAREMGLVPQSDRDAEAEARARAELDKHLKYGNQVHVRLAMRMLERDPGSAPHCNDRVPYVIVRRGQGVPFRECGEDPVFALEKGLPVDYDYYLEKQLRKPLKRIFKHLDRDCMRVLVDRVEARPRMRNRALSEFVAPDAASGMARGAEPYDAEDEADEDALNAADAGYLARLAAEAEEAASAMPDNVVRDDEAHEPSERTYRWLCRERERVLEPLRRELRSRSSGLKRTFSGTGSVATTRLERLMREGTGRCEACRAPCPGALCDECRDAELPPRLDAARQASCRAEEASRAAWDECRRCVGSEQEALLCENRGCENLLYRLQLKTEAEQRRRRLERYERCRARPHLDLEYEEEGPAEPMDVCVVP